MEGVKVKTESLSITGMTCAACSARIEKVVSKMDGVNNISVNLLTKRATVQYNNEKVKIDEIINRIEKIGYGASKIETRNGRVSIPAR